MQQNRRPTIDEWEKMAPVEQQAAPQQQAAPAEPSFLQQLLNAVPQVPIVGPGADAAIGAIKGLFNTLTSLPGIASAQNALYRRQPAPDVTLQPTSPMQQVGQTLEQMSEFAVPSTMALRGAKAIAPASPFLRWATGAGLEGLGSAGMHTIQQRGDPANAEWAAGAGMLGAMIAPPVGHVMGQVGRQAERLLLRGNPQHGFDVENVFKHNLGGSVQTTFDLVSKKIDDVAAQLRAELTRPVPSHATATIADNAVTNNTTGPYLLPSGQQPRALLPQTTTGGTPRFYGGRAGVADVQQSYPYDWADPIKLHPTHRAATLHPGEFGEVVDVGPVIAAEQTVPDMRDPAQLVGWFRQLAGGAGERMVPNAQPLRGETYPLPFRQIFREGGEVVNPPHIPQRLPSGTGINVVDDPLIAAMLRGEMTPTMPVSGTLPNVDIGRMIANVEQQLHNLAPRKVGQNTALMNALETRIRQDPHIQEVLNRGGTADILEGQNIKQSMGDLGSWAFGQRSDDSNAIEQVANLMYTQLREGIENAAVAGPQRIRELNQTLGELMPIRHAAQRTLGSTADGMPLSFSDVFWLNRGYSMFPIAHMLGRTGTAANMLVKGGEALPSAAIPTLTGGVSQAAQQMQPPQIRSRNAVDPQQAEFDRLFQQLLLQQQQRGR